MLLREVDDKHSWERRFEASAIKLKIEFGTQTWQQHIVF